MMSRTLGAPFGGTTRGGHQGFDSEALSLITPPNFGSGGGSCFPLIVVVALGEPNSPVTCCAVQYEEWNVKATPDTVMATTLLIAFIRDAPNSMRFCRPQIQRAARNARLHSAADELLQPHDEFSDETDRPNPNL